MTLPSCPGAAIVRIEIIAGFFGINLQGHVKLKVRMVDNRLTS